MEFRIISWEEIYNMTLRLSERVVSSKFKPDIIGASALLITTRIQQKNLIEALKKEGLRNRVKVMIGGAPTSREWAEKIGADAYARNAATAAQIASKLMAAKDGGR